MLIMNDDKNRYTLDDFMSSKKVFNTVTLWRELAKEKGIWGNERVLVKLTEENMGEEPITYFSVEGLYIETDDSEKLQENVLERIANFPVNFDEFDDWMEEFINMNAKEDYIVNEIAQFVSKPGAYKDFHNMVAKRVLGQENLGQVTYSVFTWLRGLATGKKTKENALICAPSGSGKTETFRAIKAAMSELICDIPVIQLDTTQLTAAGYQGKEIDEFFAPLLNESANGIAIVVLDEFDKKLCIASGSIEENSNFRDQSALLTTIEGTILSGKTNSVDTVNTCFIACGAFQYIRDAKNESSVVPRTMGFNVTDLPKANLPVDQYEDITKEDILKYGGMAEIIGRFNSIVNYHKLDKESVYAIVDCYVKEYEEVLGFKIKINPLAKAMLYTKYNESPFGCRIIKSEIWEKIYPIARHLEMEGIDKNCPEAAIVVNVNGAHPKTFKSEKKRVLTN